MHWHVVKNKTPLYCAYIKVCENALLCTSMAAIINCGYAVRHNLLILVPHVAISINVSLFVVNKIQIAWLRALYAWITRHLSCTTYYLSSWLALVYAGCPFLLIVSIILISHNLLNCFVIVVYPGWFAWLDSTVGKHSCQCSATSVTPHWCLTSSAVHDEGGYWLRGR